MDLVDWLGIGWAVLWRGVVAIAALAGIFFLAAGGDTGISSPQKIAQETAALKHQGLNIVSVKSWGYGDPDEAKLQLAPKCFVNLSIQGVGNNYQGVWKSPTSTPIVMTKKFAHKLASRNC